MLDTVARYSEKFLWISPYLSHVSYRIWTIVNSKAERIFFTQRENQAPIHVKLLTFRLDEIKFSLYQNNSHTQFYRRCSAAQCSAGCNIDTGNVKLHTVVCGTANKHTDTHTHKAQTSAYIRRSVATAKFIKAEWMRANDTHIWLQHRPSYAVIVWPPYNFNCVLYKTHCIPSTVAYTDRSIREHRAHVTYGSATGTSKFIYIILYVVYIYTPATFV